METRKTFSIWYLVDMIRLISRLSCNLDPARAWDSRMGLRMLNLYEIDEQGIRKGVNVQYTKRSKRKILQIQNILQQSRTRHEPFDMDYR